MDQSSMPIEVKEGLGCQSAVAEAILWAEQETEHWALKHWDPEVDGEMPPAKKYQCIPISKVLVLYLLRSAFENLMKLFPPHQCNRLFHELLDLNLLHLSSDHNAHQC
jgi:hypothetical protein